MMWLFKWNLLGTHTSKSDLADCLKTSSCVPMILKFVSQKFNEIWSTNVRKVH